jgi:hypothetical protein
VEIVGNPKCYYCKDPKKTKQSKMEPNPLKNRTLLEGDNSYKNLFLGLG